MRTLIIVAVIVIALYSIYRIYRIVNLDKGLDKKIAAGAVILDVRTATEYETGHIEGSLNISLGRLRTDTIPLPPEQVIITCCSHGLRSVKAVEILKNRGFKNVYNGGAWVDLQRSVLPLP